MPLAKAKGVIKTKSDTSLHPPSASAAAAAFVKQQIPTFSTTTTITNNALTTTTKPSEEKVSSIQLSSKDPILNLPIQTMPTVIPELPKPAQVKVNPALVIPQQIKENQDSSAKPIKNLKVQPESSQPKIQSNQAVSPLLKPKAQFNDPYDSIDTCFCYKKQITDQSFKKFPFIFLY